MMPCTMALVFLSIKMDIAEPPLRLRLCNEFYDLFCAVFHGGCGENIADRCVLQNLASFGDLRALETDDDGDGEGFAVFGDEFCGFDDAVGDVVAAVDAAEDVDEDALCLSAFEHDVKGGCDLLGGGVAADVEEVRGLAAAVLEHIDGRHGKTRAVDHACNVAAEVDVVESVRGGFEFLRIFFAVVAELGDVGVAVECAVVKVELGVEGNDVVVLGDDERVDLDLRAVLADEGGVETLHERRGFAHCRCGDVDGVCHARRLERHEPDDRVDVLLDDLLGVLFGDLFDLDAALLGAHHDDAGAEAVNNEGEVKFFFDLRSLFDEQAVDDLALGSRLMRDERLAEQFARVAAHFVGRLCDLDAARFAAAARVDLCLDDDDGGAELFGVVDGSVYGECGQSVRDFDAVFAQHLFGLILVNVHLPNPPFCE